MRDGFFAPVPVVGVQSLLIFFDRLLRKALIVVCRIYKVRIASSGARAERVVLFRLLAKTEDNLQIEVGILGSEVDQFIYRVIGLVVDDDVVGIPLQVVEAKVPLSVGIHAVDSCPM